MFWPHAGVVLCEYTQFTCVPRQWFAMQWLAGYVCHLVLYELADRSFPTRIHVRKRRLRSACLYRAVISVLAVRLGTYQRIALQRLIRQYVQADLSLCWTHKRSWKCSAQVIYDAQYVKRYFMPYAEVQGSLCIGAVGSGLSLDIV